MKPTNELRFVERAKPAPHMGEGVYTTIRVLQQKWTYDEFDFVTGKPVEEWRDVPLVLEGAA